MRLYMNIYIHVSARMGQGIGRCGIVPGTTVLLSSANVEHNSTYELRYAVRPLSLSRKLRGVVITWGVEVDYWNTRPSSIHCFFRAVGIVIIRFVEMIVDNYIITTSWSTMVVQHTGVP